MRKPPLALLSGIGRHAATMAVACGLAAVFLGLLLQAGQQQQLYRDMHQQQLGAEPHEREDRNHSEHRRAGEHRPRLAEQAVYPRLETGAAGIDVPRRLDSCRKCESACSLYRVP